jgi:hypothetical protein
MLLPQSLPLSFGSQKQAQINTAAKQQQKKCQKRERTKESTPTNKQTNK